MGPHAMFSIGNVEFLIPVLISWNVSMSSKFSTLNDYKLGALITVLVSHISYAFGEINLFFLGVYFLM